MNRLIAASLYLFCTVLLATPPVTDQWELKKKTAGGFESFGLTAENGKVIGFTDGVPTMLSLMAGSGSVTSVAISGTDGIEIDSGSPVTTAGTIALGINVTTLKTHLSLSNVENTALSTWAGTTNITTLGTIATGVWNGTAIGTGYLASGVTLDTEWDTAAEINAATTDADFLTTTAAALAYQPLDTDLTTLASSTAAGLALMDDTDASAQRTTLGLGTLATQSGTFSGTSSGTNTGDNAVNSLYSGLVSNATHTGDATGSTALTVVGINGTILSTLGTGILKNTTTTGVPSIAVAGDFPTLNQNTTGNAATATALATARAINGVNFDGTAPITVTAAAGTLTGDTLASNVLTSSLTTVGTIGTGVWNGTAIGTSYLASGATLDTEWDTAAEINAATTDADFLTTTAAALAYQPLDTDLTTYAGITPSANVQTLLGSADYSAFKTSLSLNSVENTALSTWAGTSNITTLGTIAAGTWNGSVIGSAYGGAGAVSGIMKADGLGTVSAASAGTDYEAPVTFSTGLTDSSNTITVDQTFAPTWTGIHTFTPAARSSGSASYFVINTPADTGLTAATESVGVKFTGATRTFADGTIALQRERYFSAPTYNKTTTSATITDVFNLYLDKPVNGTGVTFTRPHTLGIVDATSASSSITGGLIVATTLGTSATSVGIGGGNVYMGGNLNVGGTQTHTGALTQTGAATFNGTVTQTTTARSSGSAAYYTLTTPADTNATTGTEHIGAKWTAATRQHATGALTLQRERLFDAPTYSFVGASTLTTAINVDIADPIQGTNATITNAYSLRAANVLFTGLIKAGSAPTTLTDSTGKILSASLNTVAVANGGTGATTLDDLITLGTHTTGNYMADVSGTSNEISVSHTPAEGSTATLSLPADINLGGKTSLQIPNGAAPTVDAFGEIAGDNDLWAASRGAPIFFDGTAATALVNVLVSDTPSNGQVPVWNTGGTITWETPSGTGTVTSVAVSGSDGIDIDSGSPITGAGTIALGINASTLKTHLSLNNVENTALSTWAGTANITTLGTIATGVWNGTAIGTGYLASGATLDTEWDTLAEVETAMGAINILAATEVDTSAEIIAILGDESGTGNILTTNGAGGSLTGIPTSISGTSNEITASAGTGAVTLSIPATVDLGGKTSFEVPNGAAPTVDAFGEIAGDNDLWAASRGAPIFFDGTAATALVNVLVSDTPSNGQVPVWNTGGTITWETPSGSGTVTATGGSLTANSVVLGAGTTDTKVVAGVTTDGTSKLNLGVAGASTGKIDLSGSTSGTVTVQPAATAGTWSLTLPANDGDSGQVLQTNGSGTTTWATAGGGLTNITETLRTASPNNTVNVEELAVSGGSTNTDLLFKPMGTGAIMAWCLPDSTATGGNKRGTYAIDFQPAFRNSGADVASGAHSVIIAGRYNKSSGDYSFSGGYFNTVTGYAAYGYGYQQTASGNYTGALSGYQNTASGTASVVSGGQLNTASGDYSSASGYYANSTRYGQRAAAAGVFAAVGDAQHVQFVVRNKTTTNSAVVLFLDGSSTRLTIPSGKVLSCTINVSGIKSDGSAVAHYMRQYSIKNVGGTTSEVYAAVTIGTDNAAGTSLAISADDTNDALKIEPTGITSETWRWTAVVEGVEIAYGN